MPERRNFPRVRVQIPVSCSPLNARTVSPPFDGTTLDLSAGGLGVEIPTDQAIGAHPPERSHLLVRFRLPEIPKAFQIPSRVVWVGRRPRGSLGIEFLIMSFEERTLLAEFVEHNRQNP